MRFVTTNTTNKKRDAQKSPFVPSLSLQCHSLHRQNLRQMSTVRASKYMQMQKGTDDETSNAQLCLHPSPSLWYMSTTHLTPNFATVLRCDPSVRQFHSVIHLFCVFQATANSLLCAMLSVFHQAHRKCYTNAQFFSLRVSFLLVPFAHGSHDVRYGAYLLCTARSTTSHRLQTK